MGIISDDIARTREATDMVALVSEQVALKRVGRRYSGLCPFHQEKSPSFSVNPELGLYYCFGCGVSGDAITFVRETEHLDFADAVERLAGRAGITLRYDEAAESGDRKRRSRLIEATAAAIEIYHHELLADGAAGRARSYLRSRGYDGDVAKQFSLGWAPDSFDFLSMQLQEKKFSRDDIVTAGLGFINKANRVQDFFRSRLLFPIFDAKGDAIGFGGRTLDGDGPKYRNTPETPIYHKSRVLYGLNWAKGEIVARGDVVICEGYTDVMALVLSGVPNAVATCGTALADDHVGLIKNLARKVVLAYDADAAGQAAAERCYQWEEKFQVQFQVADLPTGRDPGDLWPADPELLARSIAAATPFLRFRLERMMSVAELTTVEGRANAAENAAVIIGEHPSDLVRDQYVMELSERLSIEPDRLRTALQFARSPEGRARRAPGSLKGSGAARTRDQALAADREHGDEREARLEPLAVDRRESDALRWAIHDPDLVADWIDVALFADPTALAAFNYLAGADTFLEALENSEGQARLLLERLAVEEPDQDDDPESVRPRLMANLLAPAAARLATSLARADDDRSTVVKKALDQMDNFRENGNWRDVERAALELLRDVLEMSGK